MATTRSSNGIGRTSTYEKRIEGLEKFREETGSPLTQSDIGCLAQADFTADEVVSGISPEDPRIEALTHQGFHVV